jgi:hypothetical protein
MYVDNFMFIDMVNIVSSTFELSYRYYIVFDTYTNYIQPNISIMNEKLGLYNMFDNYSGFDLN